MGRFGLLASLPLSSIVVLFQILHGLSTGLCFCGSLEDFGFGPMGGPGGGGAAVWVAGVLKAPGTEGDWLLGQQEKRSVCSNQYINMPFCDGLRTPTTHQRNPTSHSLQDHRALYQKQISA